MKKMYPKEKFTKHASARRRRLLAELPDHVQQRQQNIYNRNQMLAGMQAYNLRLEKQRIQSHMSDFVAPLQTAVTEHHMGDLNHRMHNLATAGLPF